VNKILKNLLIFTLVPGFVCAGGGDSFAGGLAGGMMGGVVAGAMTQPRREKTVVVQQPVQQATQDYSAEVARLREEVNKLYQKLGSLETENKMLKEQVESLKEQVK
jgi:hypothetical protein